MATSVEVPPDWYRSGFPPITAAMPWTDRTEAEVDRAIMMLRPEGGERVLDLACGIGRHSLELRRRGFEVVGVDISPELLEIAERSAAEEGLEVAFMQADLRELAFADEFDLVLSLNDGAVGYFETDAENRRTFGWRDVESRVGRFPDSRGGRARLSSVSAPTTGNLIYEAGSSAASQVLRRRRC